MHTFKVQVEVEAATGEAALEAMNDAIDQRIQHEEFLELPEEEITARFGAPQIVP